MKRWTASLSVDGETVARDLLSSTGETRIADGVTPWAFVIGPAVADRGRERVRVAVVHGDNEAGSFVLATANRDVGDLALPRTLKIPAEDGAPELVVKITAEQSN